MINVCFVPCSRWRFRERMPGRVIERLHTNGGQIVLSDSFDVTIADTDFIISTLIEDIDLMKTIRVVDVTSK